MALSAAPHGEIVALSAAPEAGLWHSQFSLLVPSWLGLAGPASGARSLIYLGGYTPAFLVWCYSCWLMFASCTIDTSNNY